jgi:hypothetical protein
LLFVTTETLMPILFSLAILARLLIAVVAAHWVSIGVVSLMGSDPDGVVETTRVVLLLVVFAAIAGILVGRRQPGAKERMAAGRHVATQWRPLVLAVGIASEFGGLLMFVEGNHQAGSWAMALGTAMVISELAAIAGGWVAGNSN